MRFRKESGFDRTLALPRLGHRAIAPVTPDNIFDKTAQAAYVRRTLDGVVAQLVERLVRNEKVRGSNPLTSTPMAWRGRPARVSSGKHGHGL